MYVFLCSFGFCYTTSVAFTTCGVSTRLLRVAKFEPEKKGIPLPKQDTTLSDRIENCIHYIDAIKDQWILQKKITHDVMKQFNTLLEAFAALKNDVKAFPSLEKESKELEKIVISTLNYLTTLLKEMGKYETKYEPATSKWESGDKEKGLRKTVSQVNDIYQALDALENSLKDIDQATRHTALMAGVGLAMGYHHHTKNYIFNLKAGVDYMGGQFKQTEAYNASTDHNPSLGWGAVIGAGVDYKFSKDVAMGLEGGVRISQFVLPKVNYQETCKKTSVVYGAPYGQINCTIFPYPKWSIGLFTGYFFPRQFKIDHASSNIPIGTKCRIDGVYGGLKFSYYLD